MNIHRINWTWASSKAMKQLGITEMPKTWAEFNADCDKAVAAKLICVAHLSQDWTDATTMAYHYTQLVRERMGAIILALMHQIPSELCN